MSVLDNSPQFELDFADSVGGESSGAIPRIRVSARARRLSIRVYPDARVEVVVPPRAQPRDVQQFIGMHREWMDQRRAMAMRNRPEPQAFPPAEIALPACGESWRLHRAGGVGRLRLTELGAPGELARVLHIAGAAEGPALRASLRGWLLRAARHRLAPRLTALSAITGVPYTRMEVRRQRSRWGSCSSRGTISLNCCLLFQRPEVVDYLIVHELMHVRHMNHSARFWQAVERHCAGWRELDRELVLGWRHVPHWVFSDV